MEKRGKAQLKALAIDRIEGYRPQSPRFFFASNMRAGWLMVAGSWPGFSRCWLAEPWLAGMDLSCGVRKRAWYLWPREKVCVKRGRRQGRPIMCGPRVAAEVWRQCRKRKAGRVLKVESGRPSCRSDCRYQINNSRSYCSVPVADEGVQLRRRLETI